MFPPGIKATQTQGQWEVIDPAVDSGATETVVGIGSLQSVQTKAHPANKRGTEYDVANGEKIPSFGE